MRVERIRIKRAMRGEDGAAWARALTDPSWSASATVLKDEPGSSWVRRATINGREVVVKCRFLNTRSRRLKAALGYGHGDKHWRGAAVLAARKVATARPVVLGRASVDGEAAEVLVLEYLPGPTLLEVMAAVREDGAIGPREQHRLAAAVGAQVGRLTLSGWLNRDHKPSNLIVVAADGEPAIIDAVGIRSCGARAGLAAAERMLASLVIEPTGCGVAPRRTLMLRAVRSAVRQWPHPMKPGLERTWERGLWRRVSAIVRAHGDPRPRVDPLGRR